MRRTLGQSVCIVLAIVLLTFGCMAMLFSSCIPRATRPLPYPLPLPPAPIALPTRVTVDLAHPDGTFDVACTGSARWYDAEGRPVGEPSSGPWKLASRSGKLLLDGTVRDTATLELRVEDGLFRIGSRSYRGRLRVSARPEGRFTVRNDVATVDYLRSVVGRESYTSWHDEALKAQAVIARTYLIYALGGRDYLTRADMAYHGVGEEHPATSAAVDATRGIILVYEGRILPAYFQSTCGGHTMAVEKFTDRVAPMQPLSGVTCNFCRISPHYRWEARISAVEIAGALRSSGLAQVDAVRSLQPQGRGEDGYATHLLVNGEQRVDAYAFRRAVGESRLKTVNFEVSRDGDEFVFGGRGYGHGVGLCQWGSEGMARAGYNWQEILEHYYPGAKLRSVAPEED